MNSEFSKSVYKVVKRIPKGKVLSYKEVAKRSGYPKAYRAVGNVLSKSPQDVPCHRVIKANGEVGKYKESRKKKINLLRKEGVRISNGEVN